MLLHGVNHRELFGMYGLASRNESLKSHDFPDKFPVSREMQRESGSLETVSTAIQSQVLGSLAVFPD